jgi:hypothetical protein
VGRFDVAWLLLVSFLFGLLGLLKPYILCSSASGKLVLVSYIFYNDALAVSPYPSGAHENYLLSSIFCRRRGLALRIPPGSVP